MDTYILLRSNPYFRHSSEEQLDEFLKKAQVRNLACGETLLKQNESGNNAYILLDGRLRSFRTRYDGKEQVIGEITRGEIVGETAAFLDQPRTATVVAIRNSVLLEVDRNDLINLIQSHKSSLTDFTRNIVKRSQPTFAHHNEVRSVLLFPISPGIRIHDFSRQFLECLEKYRSVRCWSAKSFMEATGIDTEVRGDSDHSEIQAKLLELETECEMTVLSSDGNWDLWTKACAYRADSIVLLARHTDFHPPTKAELRMWDEINKANQVRVELVLLHPSAERLPERSRQWLENRKIFRHHHLVEGDSSTTATLARFLTGNAIGFALSGGGFKSALQAGILHAMAEGGIPMDIIGGSSGGAFAGAIFANRPPLKEIPDVVTKSMNRFRKVARLTFPIVSLYSGKGITQAMLDFFGNQQLEDLWTNYFCTSLSLKSGALIVHRKGAVWEAVRASSSVMGLLPPVITNDDVLVDGGFINPCPTDVLHQIGAGKVVVVSAFGKAGLKETGNFPPSVSGWNLLARYINPFYKKKISPKIGSSILQSMLFASTYLLSNVFQQSAIDLLIEPDVSQFSPQDNNAVTKMYESGYEFGIRNLSKWKLTLGLD